MRSISKRTSRLERERCYITIGGIPQVVLARFETAWAELMQTGLLDGDLIITIDSHPEYHREPTKT